MPLDFGSIGVFPKKPVPNFIDIFRRNTYPSILNGKSIFIKGNTNFSRFCIRKSIVYQIGYNDLQKCTVGFNKN